MANKIQPGKSASLCATCKHSQIIETDSTQSVTYCNYGYEGRILIKFVVKKCNQYEDGAISLSDMYDMAWTLNTNKKGILGFRPPERKNG